MRFVSKTIALVVALAALVGVAGWLVFLKTASEETLGVPTPTAVRVVPPTPWPVDFTPFAPITATATIYEISNVVDMDPTIPAEDKGEVVIRKANGTYIKILAIPNLPMSKLPLELGDVVIQISSPSSLVGGHPSAPVVTATQSASPLTPTGATPPTRVRYP
jgi:hypothetical protein